MADPIATPADPAATPTTPVDPAATPVDPAATPVDPAAATTTDPALANKDGETAGAPETYTDFNLPDGMEMDKAAMEAFLPVAKDLNLTQEQSQKLVDLQTKQVAAQAEAQQVAWDATNDEWRDETKSDANFGGANLQANLASSNVFLNKFSTPELRTMLDETGIGNRLPFLQMCAAAGKAMGDDNLNSGPTLGQSKTVEQLFYDNPTSHR